MKKKMFLTSALAIGFVAPAFAEPSYTDTFPDDGYMQEDYTYTNAATADNMDDVYEGTVNAVAEYDIVDYILSAGQYLPADSETPTTCPVGSFCSGIGNVNYNQTSAQGIETCPTNYTSEAGASAQNQCYQTCTASCTNPEIGAHVKSGSVVLGTETASGRNYYGSSCDAVAPVCSIQSYECDNGYHKYDPYAPTYEDLITYIMSLDGLEESEAKAEYPTYAAAKKYLAEDSNEWNGVVISYGNPKKYGPSANENLKSKVSSADYTINGTDRGCTRLNGDAGEKESEYGLTQGSGEWVTTFEYGVIRGISKCTATPGSDGEQWGMQGDPDATTSGEAKYCWCQGTGIKGTNGTLQSLASSWVFADGNGSASNCAYFCASDCALIVQNFRGFRAALFGSADDTALCEANTITINWSNADAEDISANNAGTATYGGDVRTPVKAETIKGKTFKGWKFSKPEQTTTGGSN